MTNAITTTTLSNRAVLIPKGATGHTRHRLVMYADWLDATQTPWHAPDLEAYRDYLMSNDRVIQRGETLVASPLSPNSAQTHLSTIRGQYRRLLRSNVVRKGLFGFAEENGIDNPKAFTDEVLIRLANAVEPEAAPVRVIHHQDTVDSVEIRLTRSQSGDLMNAPGRLLSKLENTPHRALRDTAMIVLMLCTGIREMELIGLDVPDLRQRTNGVLSLHVREGKGAKARTIPYGDMDWCLAYAERWLNIAGIESGAVFRGFYKDGKGLRPGRLSVRAVNMTLARYPVIIDGVPRVIKPHDLRRTYARRLYEEGVEPVAIQQNLGHANLKTTLRYIGNLDIDQRRPPAVYDQPDWIEVR